MEYVEGEDQAPDPGNSDLWVATDTVEGDLLYRWSAPDDTGDWALLIFRDGEEAAPSAVSVEETETASQTGGIIMTVLGALALLLAVALFYWALSASRRKKDEDTPDDSDGDAAAHPDQAEDTSQEADVDAEAHKNESVVADTGSESSQRNADLSRAEHSKASHGSRSIFSVALGTVAALASAIGVAGPGHAEEADQDAEQQEAEQEDADQDDAEDPAEDEDADTGNGEDHEAPEEDDAEPGDDEMEAEGYSVLLDAQLEGILEDVSTVAAEADEEQDADLLEDRFDGDALRARELAYRNHSEAETGLPDPIGTEVLSAAVTSDQDFPRQAVVFTEHPDLENPQILVLQQDSARDNYKLVTVTSMVPGTEFSPISAEQGGITPIDSDDEASSGTTPSEALSGMADFFSDSEADFGSQIMESTYLENLHQYYEDLEEDAEDTEIDFPDPEVWDDITALELPDGSTLVAGSFEREMQMAPLEDGDTIFLDDELVQELTGTDWTTFPATMSTQDSVVLQLPPEEAEDDAVLLGVYEVTSGAEIDSPDWFDGYDEDDE